MSGTKRGSELQPAKNAKLRRQIFSTPRLKPVERIRIYITSIIGVKQKNFMRYKTIASHEALDGFSN
jgi:hypothetical protein